MKLKDLPANELDEVKELMGELIELINERLGADHDVVVLVHKSHEQGSGKCHGVQMLTPVDNMHVLAGILQQTFENVVGAIHAMQIPPGASLQ